MFLDENVIAVDKYEVPGQSDAVDEDPMLQKRHGSSHDKRREEMHVQSVPRIPEFSTRRERLLATDGQSARSRRER